MAGGMLEVPVPRRTPGRAASVKSVDPVSHFWMILVGSRNLGAGGAHTRSVPPAVQCRASGHGNCTFMLRRCCDSIVFICCLKRGLKDHIISKMSCFFQVPLRSAGKT